MIKVNYYKIILRYYLFIKYYYFDILMHIHIT
jgi:hypothetical protein